MVVAQREGQYHMEMLRLVPFFTMSEVTFSLATAHTLGGI